MEEPDLGIAEWEDNMGTLKDLAKRANLNALCQAYAVLHLMRETGSEGPVCEAFNVIEDDWLKDFRDNLLQQERSLRRQRLKTPLPQPDPEQFRLAVA